MSAERPTGDAAGLRAVILAGGKGTRLWRGRVSFQGSSDHTSHRLVQLGLSQPRAVLTICVAAATLGALAIFLTRAQPLTAILSFTGLVIVGAVFCSPSSGSNLGSLTSRPWSWSLAGGAQRMCCGSRPQ